MRGRLEAVADRRLACSLERVAVEFAGHDQFSWEIDLAELAFSVNFAAGFKLDSDTPRAADSQTRFPIVLMIHARNSPSFEDFVGGERLKRP